MPARPKRSIRQVDLGAANAEHVHSESDITDLDHYDSSDFNNDHANADHSHDHDGDYAGLNHTHEEADITDLDHYTDADANAAIDARVNKTFVDALNVDADTVDGKHASAFADAVHTHVEADIADLDHYDSSDFAADHANADHTHDHDADYADIAHTHELDDLNATGATNGHVLTAQGDGTAAWEPPTGGGGGVTDHGDLTGLEDDDHLQYLTEARHDADDHSALTITESQISDLDHYDSTDFDSDFATKDTDDLAEGSTNLYLTDERVQDIIGAMLSGNTETRITVTYQDSDGTIDFEVDGDLSNYTNTPGWIADITGENLEDLANVTITSIASGEILVWDGSGWINQTLAEAGISAVGHTHTEADIVDLDHTDDNAIHDNVSGEIVAITAKTTPADADVTIIEDSEAANAKKSLSWANIKATLKTYFDTLYATVVHTHTESDITDLDHWDQADTEGVIDAYVDKTFVDALNVDADTLDGEHASAFADAVHTHELDELDATGITGGHVLTAQGDGTAEWEAPTTGVTDHGALTGLADDDHPQYLLANGSRNISGDIVVDNAKSIYFGDNGRIRAFDGVINRFRIESDIDNDALEIMHTASTSIILESGAIHVGGSVVDLSLVGGLGLRIIAPTNGGLPSAGAAGQILVAQGDGTTEWTTPEPPPTPDYVLLGEATGGSTFMEVDNIPQTYRDLIIHWHGDHDGAAQFEVCTLRFNTTSDTSAYRYAVQYKNLVGTAGNTSSSSNTFAVVGYVSDSSTSSSGVITIPNYTGAGVILGFTTQGWASRGAADNASRTWYGGGRRERVKVNSVLLGVNGDWSSDSVMRVYGVGAL